MILIHQTFIQILLRADLSINWEYKIITILPKIMSDKKDI